MAKRRNFTDQFKAKVALTVVLIQRDRPKLSISQQCKLVSLIRSAFCYMPIGINTATLDMLKRD